MEISTVTPIALGVILIFALVGALRGGLRVAASFASLLAGGLLAFILVPVVEPFVAATPIPLALHGLAALAIGGILVFLALRTVFGIALSLRERKRRRQNLQVRSSLDRGLGGLLGAAWGTLLVLVVMTGISLIYDVQKAMEIPSEALAVLESPDDPSDASYHLPPEGTGEIPGTIPPPLAPAGLEAVAGPIESLGRRVSSSIFGPLVEKASPLGKNQGETITNFVSLLEDPEGLQRLRNQPEVQNLLQSPLILEATEDPDIASAIRRRDIVYLLNHPTIASLARDPDLRREILSLDLDGLLERSKSD